MRKLLILIVIVTFTVPVFGGWRRANLFGAGVRALIIDPARPDTLYLGPSGGGGDVSDDGAKGWRNPRGAVPFPGYRAGTRIHAREGRLWGAGRGLRGGGL